MQAPFRECRFNARPVWRRPQRLDRVQSTFVACRGTRRDGLQAEGLIVSSRGVASASIATPGVDAPWILLHPEGGHHGGGRGSRAQANNHRAADDHHSPKRVARQVSIFLQAGKGSRNLLLRDSAAVARKTHADAVLDPPLSSDPCFAGSGK